VGTYKATITVRNSGNGISAFFSGSLKVAAAQDPGAASGKSYIRHLILPDVVESIKAGSSDPNGNMPNNITFRYFTNFMEVTDANIKTIGDSAFFGCERLASINFPEAVTIGN
jgi:hypothetical protein